MKRTTPVALIAVTACVLTTTGLLLNPFVSQAQDAASSATPAQSVHCAATATHDAVSSVPPDYVSRAEYDKLKAEHEAMMTEHEAMKQELEALQATVQQMAVGTVAEAPRKKTAQPPGEGPNEGKQVAAAEAKQAVTPPTETETTSVELAGPLATHDFSIVGDAEVQFGKFFHQHGAFQLADFAPIFLFRGGDKILFE